MPEISIRLKTIADLVREGAKVCDVGTDHGYLAIYLLKERNAARVIATDLNEKPLSRAKENIAAAGCEGKIELRLCDGLNGVSNGEIDTAVIAGMGGEVIAGIIERSKAFSFNGGVTFILQPTTSPEALRRFLCENGFGILSEIPVFENGKLYSVMVCRYTGNMLKKSEGFYYIGLVKSNCEAGRLYIEKQKKRLFDCVKAVENNADRAELYREYKKAYDEIVSYSEN